jgi:hypothetical protein
MLRSTFFSAPILTAAAAADLAPSTLQPIRCFYFSILLLSLFWFLRKKEQKRKKESLFLKLFVWFSYFCDFNEIPMELKEAGHNQDNASVTSIATIRGLQFWWVSYDVCFSDDC